MPWFSPMVALGAFYNTECGAMNQPGEIRERYIARTRENVVLASAMDAEFPVAVAEENLKILNGPWILYCRNLKKGGPSGNDGLICEAVRMGHRLKVPVPIMKK